MGLMLIGLMCAFSFIALQSTKNKELQKKLDKNDDKVVINSEGEERFSELLK
jgi:hypothetical protein